ncbi:GNAT family N-acetyltransferase [Caenimonas koreensis]|uniref:GNAT family N-acetyltransferase n=1 Tax=Caenimonas koreensis TaxID=367474 RepID=UPI0037836BCC
MSPYTSLKLREQDAHIWFSVLPRRDEAAERAVTASLAAGLLKPDLRMVALLEGKPVARMLLRNKGNVVHMYSPGLSPQLAVEHQAPVILALTKSAVSECDRHFAGRVQLLAEPAHDVAFCAEWLDALTACGFIEKSCYRMLVASTERPHLKSHADAVELAEADEPAISAIRAAASLNTFDRRQDTSADYVHRLLGNSKDSATRHWLGMRCSAGDLVAYCITYSAEIPEIPGPAAWLAQIDTKPEFRGRGLGQQLIETAMYHFARAGIANIASCVDVMNKPSLALHAKTGFKFLPGLYFDMVRLPSDRELTALS